MSCFPVLSSTILPGAIAEFVKEKYFPNADISCRLLKAGINHTYLVEGDAGTYIFRVYSYNWRTREEIEEEIALLTQLKQHNLSISHAIADYEQNYIHVLHAPEGERYATLFSFASGNKMLHYSEEVHFEIGRLMAQIHSVTENLTQNRVTYDFDILLENPLKHVGRFLKDDTKEIKILAAIAKLLKEKINAVDTSKLRTGIVHMDIWFDNLNISPDNKITLFDFDFCGNGWLCLDLAYYTTQLYNTEKDEEQCKRKIESFLNGYKTVQKISAEESELLRSLGICIFLFYLGVQCYRFDNWSNVFINEVYLKRFIEVFIKTPYEKIYGIIEA